LYKLEVSNSISRGVRIDYIPSALTKVVGMVMHDFTACNRKHTTTYRYYPWGRIRKRLAEYDGQIGMAGNQYQCRSVVVGGTGQGTFLDKLIGSV
jgi:hypothetical protein